MSGAEIIDQINSKSEWILDDYSLKLDTALQERSNLQDKVIELEEKVYWLLNNRDEHNNKRFNEIEQFLDHEQRPLNNNIGKEIDAVEHKLEEICDGVKNLIANVKSNQNQQQPYRRRKPKNQGRRLSQRNSNTQNWIVHGRRETECTYHKGRSAIHGLYDINDYGEITDDWKRPSISKEDLEMYPSDNFNRN
jgi:DNA repair exonuclease SbcCD ATPase subunit